MPILANAKKALRVSKRKAEYNRIIRSKLKTMFDAVAKKMTLETRSVHGVRMFETELIHAVPPRYIDQRFARLRSRIG